MPTFHGFLYAVLANQGTKSEGPEYYLQQETNNQRVVKKARAWQGDATLHAFLGQKVSIEGTSRQGGIEYNQIKNFVAPSGVAESIAEGGIPDNPGAAGSSIDREAVPALTGRPTIRPGDVGLDVVYLQERLRQLGYPVTVDAVFGSRVKQHVEEFQAANNLPITGNVDSRMWTALEAKPIAESV